MGSLDPDHLSAVSDLVGFENRHENASMLAGGSRNPRAVAGLDFVFIGDIKDEVEEWVWNKHSLCLSLLHQYT